jgi:hypothetical protein
MSAALPLQQAMRTALVADGGLIRLLGGAHVFDEVPRGAKAPYVTFEQCDSRDWSTATEAGEEHVIQLEVTTAERARGQAQAICDRVEAVLDDAALTLAGHRLVNLRLVFWSVARSRSDPSFGATLRFRAATEPQQEH